MSKKQAATLGASLIVSKGGASPTPAVASGSATMSPRRGVSVAGRAPAHADATKAGPLPYAKALTLKLDAARYRALKMAGLGLDLSSQEILTQALDAWLAVHPEPRR